MRKSAGVVAGLTVMAGFAFADSVPDDAGYAQFSDPKAVVAAVQTAFEAEPGTPVRISVFKDEHFLEMASLKHQGAVDEAGLALITVRGLKPGEYAFSAYLDQNRDGQLNRGAFGIPTEPVAFSNGIVPRLRRPEFDEAKVDVGPGSVVVITLED